MSFTSKYLPKIELAEMYMREKCKIDLIAFLQTDTDIPRRTGHMVQSAVDHLLTTGLSSEFELLIWFDTYYASEQEQKKKFMEKIYPKILQIIKNNIGPAFLTQGLRTEVQ
jgi:hypothetical protein